MGVSSKVRNAWACVVFVLLCASGCGGGGSSSSSGVLSTGAPVKFTLSWGARSRAISGPSSALSAVLTLTGANASSSGGDVVAEEDRHVDPAAYSQGYISLQSAKPGTYPLSVKFYDQAAGTGDIVATGAASVTISSDGSGIGTVTVTNTVTTVAVVPGQIVYTPQLTQLNFSAKDANGAIVAVSPGSATWTQVDGASAMSLSADGVAVPAGRGMSNVSVTVDGITSATGAVEATANPSGTAIVLNFDAMPAVPTQVSGTFIPVADRLSTLYQTTHGISFSSVAPYVAVMTMPTGMAPSAPNCIGGASADGFIAYGQAVPVVFTFSDPLNPAAPGVTKSFAVTGDLDGRADNTVQINAYDVSGNLIGTAPSPDTGGERLSLSFANPVIHKVVFLGAPSVNDGVGLDDVTFSPVVPVAP